jgi:hypothetical protein
LTAASNPSRSDWRLSPDEGEVLSGALDEGAGELSAGAGDGAGVVSGALDEGAITSFVSVSATGLLPIRWDQQDLCAQV